MSENSIARSFELRYFSNDPVANGETDFQGETTLFDTEQRMEFLRQYADRAAAFFADPDLNTQVVSDSEVDNLISRLKEQPLPNVRSEIRLKEWQWTAARPGQREMELRRLKEWKQREGCEIQGETLMLDDSGVKFQESFPPQTWRFSLKWKIRAESVRIELSGSGNPGGAIGYTKNGRLYSSDAESLGGEMPAASDEWHEIKVEFDLVEYGWNGYVDDRKVVDFAPLSSGVDCIDSFSIEAPQGAEIAEIYGAGYHPTGIDGGPYRPETFMDETFKARPALGCWQNIDYDDHTWNTGELPIVHGGERHQGEDLYLRKTVRLDDINRALLEVETLDPAGEIWINGEPVAVSDNRHPLYVDVSKHLKENSDNLFALRVRHFVNPNEEIRNHSPTDRHIGWFAGRMSLHLTATDYIDDLFVYTSDVIEWLDKGEPVRVRIDARVRNEWKKPRFNGTLAIRLYEWYPEESETPSGEAEFTVDIREWSSRNIEGEVEIENPKLWTWQSPHLYRVEAVLKDADGQPVDDFVVTTGLRTVGQEGGRYRINGDPEMLNGAQLFGFRAPLEKIAVWSRCAPTEWLVREIAMVRKMGGNAIRTHFHAWSHIPPARGINDPRLPEIADQLGMMFIWATTAWIRSGTPWGMDLEGLPEYVRQVRNHPSIVVWEGCNHPQVGQEYERGKEEWNEFYETIHDIIYPLDPSRLITPLGWNVRSGILPAHSRPGMTMGDFHSPTGAGGDWTRLRNFRKAIRPKLARKSGAYFNLEHHPGIAQPNWNLVKGKPWYKLHSYEHNYDETSIGRNLTTDEWRESQGYQALAAWEAMKIQRILGIDGFSWCSLHGGPNTVTYKKPLIDYLGHAKLAFYINRAIFQPVVAGSADVDMVYGPDDTINPVIMHIGPERVVDLHISVKNQEGTVADQREYRRIQLPAGRGTVPLPEFKPQAQREGYYTIEYRIVETRSSREKGISRAGKAMGTLEEEIKPPDEDHEQN